MSILTTPAVVRSSPLANAVLLVERCGFSARRACARAPTLRSLHLRHLPTTFARNPRPNVLGICALLRGRPARPLARWKFSLRASTEEQSKEDEITEDKEPSVIVKKDEDSTGGVAKEPSSPDPSASVEEDKVAVGSPLPGVNPSSQASRLPKEVIEVLRNQVFGFDTFFVTGQEPYEGGVLFSGNLRGEPAKCYSKLSKRLQDKFGDEYQLFLLSNPEDDRPVSVIVPSDSLKPLPGVVPEWIAAGAFGAVSLFTVLLRNAPTLQLALLVNVGDWRLIAEGLFGALPTLAVLLAHEAGHRFAAKKIGANLSVPYFIPSWQLGSFGAITRITNILQSRKDLLTLAIAGPLSGAAVGIVIVLIGLLLPPPEGQGLIVNAAIFHESILVGGLAKLILGDSLQEGSRVAINPIVLSAWAGLLINAINSIPVGELDGGRISQALWGRKIWSRLTGVSVGFLGLAGLVSDVPLYWVVLVLFLQRGPITPQSDEITVPHGNSVALGVAVMVLGLLVYFPFLLPFSEVVPPLV